MILPNSPTEQALIRRGNALLAALSVDERVIETVALDGITSALGRAEVLQHRREAPVARFDLAVLVETSSVDDAVEIETEPLWTELRQMIETVSHHT